MSKVTGNGGLSDPSKRFLLRPKDLPPTHQISNRTPFFHVIHESSSELALRHCLNGREEHPPRGCREQPYYGFSYQRAHDISKSNLYTSQDFLGYVQSCCCTLATNAVSGTASSSCSSSFECAQQLHSSILSALVLLHSHHPDGIIEHPSTLLIVNPSIPNRSE